MKTATKQEKQRVNKLSSIIFINSIFKALRKAENAEQIEEDYIQMRRKLYSKLEPLEIKQLQDKLKNAKENKYKLFRGKTEIEENFDQLTEDYYIRYEKFLLNQPDVEDKRQKIIANIAESHRILEILKVPAELDSGLVSTLQEDEIKQEEKDKINSIIEKKLKQLDDGFIIEDIDDKIDIIDECDKFIIEEEKRFRKLEEQERNEKNQF